jgi:hypothetical protein
VTFAEDTHRLKGEEDSVRLEAVAGTDKGACYRQSEVVRERNCSNQGSHRTRRCQRSGEYGALKTVR